MATLPIAKIGNPVLRKIAEQVDPAIISTRAYQQFIDDMFATMDAHEGIGLAAPQVSRSEQLVVMRGDGQEAFPETVLINPRIVFYGPAQAEMWEGCLSVDGLRGKVTRPSSIRVRALDRDGRSM
ncbi:MAG: peptide deformylase, partial [Nitrospira sp. SB0673_bin_12]|nr:peptide deformylase [Nitrospira sp. SB0673_bin_12]